jgi:hypothetical protein
VTHAAPPTLLKRDPPDTHGPSMAARRRFGAASFGPRLPSHGFPHTRALAAERGWTHVADRPLFQRVRWVDHRRGAGNQLVKLGFDPAGVASNFVDAVVVPLRAMADTNVDRWAIISGLLLPRTSISDRIARAYRKHLFDNATLQDLPDHPRFAFNATNLQSGVLFRFSKPYLADYRVGQILKPRLAVAVAVAASPALSRRTRRRRPRAPVARRIRPAWTPRHGTPRAPARCAKSTW